MVVESVCRKPYQLCQGYLTNGPNLALAVLVLPEVLHRHNAWCVLYAHIG